MQKGPEVADGFYVSTFIYPSSWMLKEVPVVANTTFLTIREAVKMEAVNTVETLEIIGPVAGHSNSEAQTYEINVV